MGIREPKGLTPKILVECGVLSPNGLRPRSVWGFGRHITDHSWGSNRTQVTLALGTHIDPPSCAQRDMDSAYGDPQHRCPERYQL